MFIITAKVAKKRLLAIVAVLVVAILAIVMVNAFSSDPTDAVKVSGIKTNEDRVEYLSKLGWDVYPEPAEVQEVLIPETFSQVYENYNELQLECGFDLKQFAGRLVTRYSYELKSYPGVDEPVYAELLICDDCIIGGDIHSISLGGFMHALSGGPA